MERVQPTICRDVCAYNPSVNNGMYIYIYIYVITWRGREREGERERERKKNMCLCIFPSFKNDKSSMHKDLEHRSAVGGLLFR